MLEMPQRASSDLAPGSPLPCKDSNTPWCDHIVLANTPEQESATALACYGGGSEGSEGTARAAGASTAVLVAIVKWLLPC